MLAEPHDIDAILPRLEYFTFKPEDVTGGSSIVLERARSFEHGERLSMKRHRAIADVDGEGSSTAQKKKRRLRLQLITSRLSQPFATPTTYIVGRGNIRATKIFGRRPGSKPLLRRAALINWMRRKRAQTHGEVQGAAQRLHDDILRKKVTFEAAFEERCSRIPLVQPPEDLMAAPVQTPSRFGFSNYDAIDSEGDPFDDEIWCETSDEHLNSDFSKRVPIDTAISESEVFPYSDSDVATKPYPKPLHKDIMELVTDGESPHEVSFAHFG